MAAGPRGLVLQTWVIVFFVIISIFIILRLWAARVCRRRLFADDVFSIIGYAATIAQGSVTLWSVYHGTGEHERDLPEEDIALLSKIFQLPCAITWLVGTVSTKLSMLFLYTRIFSIPRFKMWSYGLIVAVAGYFVAFLILFMTNCIPLSHLWNPVPGGWCRKLTTEEYTSVAFNLVIDLAIWILPMPPLWHLQMPLRKKVFVTIMFSIGLLTIGVMCWRLQATTESLKDPDFTYHFYDIGLISCLELWLGVIVNCMPTLGPLPHAYIKPIISKLRSSVLSGESQYSERGIHLDSLASKVPRRRYYNISSSNHVNTNYAVQTECAYDPNTAPP